jgi:predicted RNase H-related nuclease YkuK (DUF458 family)
MKVVIQLLIKEHNMKISKEINIKEVVDFINLQSNETKIYVGCDSECYKDNGKWFADFASVVVVHIDGRKGCRIFGAIKKEEIHEPNKKKPRVRLMKEAYIIADLYKQLFEALGVDNPDAALNIEIHLDFNGKQEYGSSVVVEEAIGYIKAVCGTEPKIKPDAFSASYAADRLAEIASMQYASGYDQAEVSNRVYN